MSPTPTPQPLRLKIGPPMPGGGTMPIGGGASVLTGDTSGNCIAGSAGRAGGVCAAAELQPSATAISAKVSRRARILNPPLTYCTLLRQQSLVAPVMSEDEQLFDAAEQGETDMLGALLDAHPDKLNVRKPPYAWSLLHVAAHK